MSTAPNPPGPEVVRSRACDRRTKSWFDRNTSSINAAQRPSVGPTERPWECSSSCAPGLRSPVRGAHDTRLQSGVR